jgi:hypothetical protein
MVVNSKLLAGLVDILSALVYTASGCHVVVIRTVSNSQFEIDLQDWGLRQQHLKGLESKQDEEPGSPARQREIGSRSVGPNDPDPFTGKTHNRTRQCYYAVPNTIAGTGPLVTN